MIKKAASIALKQWDRWGQEPPAGKCIKYPDYIEVPRISGLIQGGRDKSGKKLIIQGK
jgi:hypothetical protein